MPVCSHGFHAQTRQSGVWVGFYVPGSFMLSTPQEARVKYEHPRACVSDTVVCSSCKFSNYALAVCSLSLLETAGRYLARAPNVAKQLGNLPRARSTEYLTRRRFQGKGQHSPQNQRRRHLRTLFSGLTQNQRRQLSCCLRRNMLQNCSKLLRVGAAAGLQSPVSRRTRCKEWGICLRLWP